MQIFLIICLLIVALLLIGIILIQQGKGAEMGASFGGGASNTLFGAPGAGNFLTKSTTILAIIFFALAIAIGVVGNDENNSVDDLIADDQPEGISVQGTEIPAETPEVISTEIPTTTAEDISTAIPTAVEDAKAEVEQKLADTEQALEEKAEAVKADAEQAVETATDELKDKAQEQLDDLKKKADDQ